MSTEHRDRLARALARRLADDTANIIFTPGTQLDEDRTLRELTEAADGEATAGLSATDTDQIKTDITKTIETWWKNFHAKPRPGSIALGPSKEDLAALNAGYRSLELLAIYLKLK